MRSRTIVTLLLMAASAPALAQYRQGEPPVLQPPPRPAPFDDRPALEAFSKAYANAGSPRIVVFWNRTFSDELGDARVKQETVSIKGGSDSITSEDVSSGPGSSSKLTERKSNYGRDTTFRSGEYVANREQRAGPNEKAIWIVEAEFTNQLGRAGVNLVDRAAIMRTTHLGQGSARGNDSRLVETAALEGKADLLMEILLAADAGAPSGWMYRITVKSVKTGVQLVNFVTVGNPPPRGGGGGYVATDRGFEHQAPPGPPSLNDVARAIGFETLQHLEPRLASVAMKARKR
jgi:hypothetical protein